jgi:hypothetical protein
MQAIEKLRAINNWAEWQNEGVNQQFKSIKGLEMAFDYAQKNNLEFIDNDYLYYEVEEEERKKHIDNINKFMKIK